MTQILADGNRINIRLQRPWQETARSNTPAKNMGMVELASNGPKNWFHQRSYFRNELCSRFRHKQSRF